MFPETKHESSEDGSRQWVSSLGSGSHRVTISTIYADIRVMEKR